MSYFDKFKTIPSVKGIPGFDLSAPLSPVVVRGDVGIEIEIEGRMLPHAGELETVAACPETGAYWTTHIDNSLRGESLEYVLSRPCSASSAEALVRALYATMATKGSKLNLSNRCSTHVHLNVSDWKIDKVTSLVVLWTLFEGPLINWNGLARKANHFCLSNKEAPELAENWIEFLSSGRWLFHDGSKYTACNLLHTTDFGSVEIRCGKASTTPEPIIDWIKFLIGLRALAMRTTPDMIPALVSEHQPDRIFQDICDEAGIPLFYEQVLRETPYFNEDCVNSFRDIQKACYAFPWESWQADINKVHIVNPFVKKKKSPERTIMPRIRGGDLRMEDIRMADLEWDTGARPRN